VHFCTYAQLSVAKGFPLAPFSFIFFDYFCLLKLNKIYCIKK
jgi:hypothetical protein